MHDCVRVKYVCTCLNKFYLACSIERTINSRRNVKVDHIALEDCGSILIQVAFASKHLYLCSKIRYLAKQIAFDYYH